jgi:hypothetical protein
MRNSFAILLLLVQATASATTVVQADNFINQVYTDLLARPADAPACSTFESPLVNGTLTTAQMALTVLTSSEYRLDLVGSYYQNYLNRPGSGAERSGWLPYFTGGGTDQGVQAQILGSLEFFGDQGSTNDGYVSALYLDLLNRPGSGAEQAPFIAALNSASLTRTQVAASFLSSNEYDHVLVSGYYQQFLRRPADPTGLNTYVSALTGGATNEQVISSIMGSPEYFSLAQPTPEPGTFAMVAIVSGLLLLARRRLAFLIL